MVLSSEDYCNTWFRIVKDKYVVVQDVQQSNCEKTTVSKRLWAGYCAFLV